jgi:hypothetical protein
MPQPAALARTDEPSIHDVIEPPARFHATTNLFSPTSPIHENWWSQTGSNRRPEACKATALPTELWPRSIPVVFRKAVVGPDRFELSTPRLSSVCSNQLSYGPAPAGAAYVGNVGAATGLVLSMRHADRGEPRVKEKRNEDGGEPHSTPTSASGCGACPSRSRGSELSQGCPS